MINQDTSPASKEIAQFPSQLQRGKVTSTMANKGQIKLLSTEMETLYNLSGLKSINDDCWSVVVLRPILPSSRLKRVNNDHAHFQTLSPNDQSPASDLSTNDVTTGGRVVLGGCDGDHQHDPWQLGGDGVPPTASCCPAVWLAGAADLLQDHDLRDRE